MTIDWDFTAQNFMDQLPPAERSKVLYAVERLPEMRHKVDNVRIARLPAPSQEEYVLRVGDDFRVVFQLADDWIRIVDVFRRSQLEDVPQFQPHR
jgi:mRNA-degrading endonuclease RelE of RelBE toxin-antitoxin system